MSSATVFLKCVCERELVWDAGANKSLLDLGNEAQCKCMGNFHCAKRRQGEGKGAADKRLMRKRKQWIERTEAKMLKGTWRTKLQNKVRRKRKEEQRRNSNKQPGVLQEANEKGKRSLNNKKEIRRNPRMNIQNHRD